MDKIDMMDRFSLGSRFMAEAKFIPASEAAERLGLALNTVKRRIDAGILAGYKDPITQRYQVSARAVADLLELRVALRRSASLPGAARPRADYLAPSVAAKRR